MRPKAGLCSFDEAMGLTLEELAERLNPARYADLPKTKKKPKATNGEMAWFKAALVKLVESQTRAVNVRRVFYLATSAKVVNKTNREAERVQTAVLWLRREGLISYEDIIDEARSVIVPPMWNDERHFLNAVVPQFRTNPWADAKTTVLVFSEKMGMSPILREVTGRYGVPLFPTIGYSGETFVWDAAQLARRAGKPVVVLQVGDYDNSGLDMMRDAEKRLRAMAAPMPVRFVRVAVKPEHIAKYDLPTRPQKEDKRGLIAVEGSRRDRRHGPRRRAGASGAGTAALHG